MEKNTPKQLAPVNGTPFDYLRWRGDLTFARDGFNEVDNLLLAELCYLDFGGIVPPGFDAPVPLQEAMRLSLIHI